VTLADGAAGRRRPAGRYGPVRTGPRGPLAVAAVAGALLLAVSWFAYVAFGPGDRGVHVLDVGYRVTGDTTVEVTFEVQKDPGATAVCRVRALNRGFAEVGLTDVRIGPAADGATTLTAVVTTSERAVSGNVKACALQ
jgi:hypothetical protein